MNIRFVPLESKEYSNILMKKKPQNISNKVGSFYPGMILDSANKEVHAKNMGFKRVQKIQVLQRGKIALFVRRCITKITEFVLLQPIFHNSKIQEKLNRFAAKDIYLIVLEDIKKNEDNKTSIIDATQPVSQDIAPDYSKDAKPLEDNQQKYEPCEKLLNLLEKFKPVMDKGKRSKDYIVISFHIQLTKLLCSQKDAILVKARELWNQAVEEYANGPKSNEDVIPSGVRFVKLLNSYLIDLPGKNRDILTYTPIFEDPKFLSLPDILPTNPQEIEMAFIFLETYLTDGVKLFERILTLIEKKPSLARSLFYDGFMYGCYAARNDALEMWLKTNSQDKDADLEKVMELDFQKTDFSMQIGHLCKIYKESCLNQAVELNQSLLYLDQAEIEDSEVFRANFNKRQFVMWSQNIVEKACVMKGIAMDLSNFNNAERIEEILDELMLFED